MPFSTVSAWGSTTRGRVIATSYVGGGGVGKGNEKSVWEEAHTLTSLALSSTSSRCCRKYALIATLNISPRATLAVGWKDGETVNCSQTTHRCEVTSRSRKKNKSRGKVAEETREETRLKK